MIAKKKGSFFRRVYKQGQLFLIMAIPLLFYPLFEYVSILKVRWVFTNFGEVPASQIEYIGLDNLKRLLGSASFMNAFKNTLIISAMKPIVGFPIPIILVLTLNEVTLRHYKKMTQTIIYFPHFPSWVVIGSIWFLILAPQNSTNAQLAETMGKQPVYWLVSKEHIRGLLVLTDMQAGAGYSAIVHPASMAPIDLTLYEAAKMDGAGKLKQIRHITLSMIEPTVVVMLIFQLEKTLNIFDQVLVMASPAVCEIVGVTQAYAHRTGVSEMKAEYGMVISVFKVIVSFGPVIITNRTAKKIDDEGIL